MTPGSKLVADHAEHRAESPRVAPALEPLQYPLASADRLARALDCRNNLTQLVLVAERLTPTTPYRRAVRSLVVPAKQSNRLVIATS
jgi:hypothetical protein